MQVWLGCDCGGEPKSTSTFRRSKSKRCGCPFKLVGTYNPSLGYWELEAENNEHNHDPAQHLEGHAFVRRLSEPELLLVEKLYAQNMEPRNIWATIKAQNQDSVCVLKDVHNAIAKMNRGKKAGQTPMQTLEHVLFNKQYVYHTREDPVTNAVEEVFFVHPRSYDLWRAFPHVLMMDATYKTNLHKMPLMQIVGVTSTGQTFDVAHAFLSNEREDNFLWMLGHLKDMLHKCMEPRVIVTDRDQALLNACAKTFPNANRSLCRWHIFTNISNHCKASFKKDD